MNKIDMFKTIKTATTKKNDCESDEDDDRHYAADGEHRTEEANKTYEADTLSEDHDNTQ
jgi:hypothetical protein